jgi:uncharacterized protein (DUF983 family)
MAATPPGPLPVPPTLKPARMLWRGLTKRCPLCGERNVFDSFFKIKDRCPRCNFPFERVEGNWLGALGMNTIVTFAAIFLVLGVGFALSWPHIAVRNIVVVAVLVAVVFPMLFLPVSHTLWCAIDLALRPLEPNDDVDPRYIPRMNPRL